MSRLVSILYGTLTFFAIFALALPASNQYNGCSLTLNHRLSRQLSNTTNPICSSPPRDSCAFYSDCLESRFHCGPDGYPIGYGQNFCQRFSDQRDLLSAEGQTWMLDTMQCLQRFLVPDATDPALANETCDALSKKAFASHSDCYVNSGLCTLPPSDWLAIVKIVQLKTLFASFDAFKATLKAQEGCLEFYLFMLKNLL